MEKTNLLFGLLRIFSGGKKGKLSRQDRLYISTGITVRWAFTWRIATTLSRGPDASDATALRFRSVRYIKHPRPRSVSSVSLEAERGTLVKME